jgi:hypothetical protein
MRPGVLRHIALELPAGRAFRPARAYSTSMHIYTGTQYVYRQYTVYT